MLSQAIVVAFSSSRSGKLAFNVRIADQPEITPFVDISAFTGTDRGLLRSVLGPWSPVPKCDAPRAPISVEEHTSMAPNFGAAESIQYQAELC